MKLNLRPWGDYVVSFSERDVRDFARTWPGFGPVASGYFCFSRKGDLEDIGGPAYKVSRDCEGGQWAAFSYDAQAWADAEIASRRMNAAHRLCTRFNPARLTIAGLQAVAAAARVGVAPDGTRWKYQGEEGGRPYYLLTAPAGYDRSVAVWHDGQIAVIRGEAVGRGPVMICAQDGASAAAMRAVLGAWAHRKQG